MSDRITIENARVTDKGVELKQSQSGKDYAQFTIMWSSTRKNRQTGEAEYGPTKFVTVRVFGFSAKDVAAAVQPGDRVNVTGSIEHFEWASQQGPKDDWGMFAESVTKPLPRAQQQNAHQDPWGSQYQGGFGQDTGSSHHVAPAGPGAPAGQPTDDEPPF